MKIQPKMLVAAGLAMGAALVAAPAMADNKRDYYDAQKQYKDENVTVCKKIAFFDKIVFKVVYSNQEKFKKDHHYDIIVKKDGVTDLTWEVIDKTKLPKDWFEIKDVTLSAVCVVFKDVRNQHYNDREEY